MLLTHLKSSHFLYISLLTEQLACIDVINAVSLILSEWAEFAVKTGINNSTLNVNLYIDYNV